MPGGMIGGAGRSPFRDSDSQGAGGLLAELLMPLSELPPESWAFGQLVYGVYAR